MKNAGRSLKKTVLAAAAATIALLGGTPAQAASVAPWGCNSVTFSGGGFVDCGGSYAPPPNDTVASINAIPLEFANGDDFVAMQQSKDENVAAGGTTSVWVDFVAGGNGSASVRFLQSLTDPFALSVKFGQRWAAYLFDIDVAANTVWNISGGPTQGGGLSHGSLFLRSTLVPPLVAPLPEPATAALLLASLGVGATLRRRRDALSPRRPGR